MRFTHEAQVMPSIGSWISVGRAAGVGSVVILLGSIAAGWPARRRSARPHWRHAADRDRRAHARRAARPVRRRGHGTRCGRGRLGRRPRTAIAGRRPPAPRARRTGRTTARRPTSWPPPEPVLQAILDGEPVDDRGHPDRPGRPPPLRPGRARGRARIGWGETASYGAIARRIGAPRASRAVGGALGRNPISLVIPCHRVIAADGTIGGYGGDGWLDRDRPARPQGGAAAARGRDGRATRPTRLPHGPAVAGRDRTPGSL